MARLIDITCTLSPRLAVWPGDEAFTRQSHPREENGHFTDLSVMRTSLHVGTHVDAPAHLLKGGASIDELELSPFLGPCEVIEVSLPPGERIHPDHVGARVRAPRVLFKTGSYPDPERFTERFNSLSPELVRWLQEQGCILTGLDTPSVDPFESDRLESHHALFACGLRYLEGLDLRHVEPGLYTLVALPLKIEGGDGSPVRAVLVED